MKLLDEAAPLLDLLDGNEAELSRRVVARVQQHFREKSSERLSVSLASLASLIEACRDLVEKWDVSDSGEKMSEAVVIVLARWEAGEKVCKELEAAAPAP